MVLISPERKPTCKGSPSSPLQKSCSCSSSCKFATNARAKSIPGRMLASTACEKGLYRRTISPYPVLLLLIALTTIALGSTSSSVAHEDKNPSFFFQAENGIRHLTVTGVQTCALPI